MYILFAGNKYYSSSDIASASIKIITNDLAEIFNLITYTELDSLGYEVKGFIVNNDIYDWLEVFNLNTKEVVFKADNTDSPLEFNYQLEQLKQLKELN